MKKQLEQGQFKKWLVRFILTFFAFSVAYPTRFLLDTRLFSAIILILGAAVLRSLFNIFYIMKNRQLNTYANIINFLEGKETKKSNWQSELGFIFYLLLATWLIFFVGTIVSALLFW